MSAEYTLEEKQVYSAVLLDVAQAFEKVRHEGLVNKLEKMFLEKYVDIITSYISVRLLKSIRKTIILIRIGVPQGSVIGPVPK